MSVVGSALDGDALREGIAALGLELDESQIDRLIAYGALIQKWNQVYNLTALRSASDMLTHHLLDSLAAVRPLERQLSESRIPTPRLLDVGSGAGLPGVIFSICLPGLSVSCVDTVSKKASFIKQAAIELRLTNLVGIHARVETLSRPKTEPFHVISSRAFASLPDFVSWSEAALAENGAWLAMKGKYPADEISALSPEITVFHVEQLAVPGLDADRCIVWMRKTVN